ncbi:MAG: hypothetical protein LBV76_05450, partial [Deltaproteobacteria bacterium]|nr:hypothetical protein [Deltaproteobacteria bacterium]
MTKNMLKNTSDFDKDLNPLLEIATDEQLGYLVEMITDTWTNGLTIEESFKEHAPKHSMYADLIAAHIRRFGGNTFSNLFRGVTQNPGCPVSEAFIGPKYHRIVCDVADHLKANYNKKQPVEVIEDAILAKMLSDTLDKMPDTEKREFLESVGVINLTGTGPALTGLAITAFRAGGYRSYQLAVSFVNAVLNKIIGRSLPFAGGAFMAGTLKFLTGPVGIALTTVWSLADLASPARRITVPAVLYIGMLRKE